MEERDGKDRRTEICQKARDLFLRYGYRKTTIEDIGKACGLGKAALYHYYSGKEEIFAEVVRVECANMLTQIRASVHAAPDPKAKLTAFVTTRVRIIRDIVGELIGNELGAELPDLLPLAARARQEFFREEAKILEQILKDGHRLGAFKKVAYPAVPHLILAGMRGIEIHLTEVQDAPSLDNSVDAMLELFFEGLCR